MIYNEAIAAYNSLTVLLAPVCNRIAPVGSLRRRKEEIFEIDVLAVPDLTPPPYPRPEFGKPIPKRYATKLDHLIADLGIHGKIFLTASGPRQKKFIFVSFEIRVDLYLCLPPATWGVLQTIRTGPHDFSQWIVTQRHKGGALPDGYRIQGGAVRLGEEKTDLGPDEPPALEMDSEASFFSFLELELVDPWKRRARWEKRSPIK